LRFAVHGPGIPAASPQVKGDGEVGGMPRGDVPANAADISGEVTRRFLPGSKGGVFTQRSS